MIRSSNHRIATTTPECYPSARRNSARAPISNSRDSDGEISVAMPTDVGRPRPSPGRQKSAQASDTLVIQPPLSSEVGHDMREAVKPSPLRMFVALVSVSCAS